MGVGGVNQSKTLLRTDANGTMSYILKVIMLKKLSEHTEEIFLKTQIGIQEYLASSNANFIISGVASKVNRHGKKQENVTHDEETNRVIDINKN